MVESNLDPDILYFYKISSSEELAMIEAGICPIFIFAQATKQQYKRQFEGLLTDSHADGVLHHSQKKITVLAL